MKYPRFGTGTTNDNSGRTITQAFEEIAYAANIALKPKEQLNTVVIGQLKGNTTLSTAYPKVHAADIVRICFSADNSNRTVNFGAGFQSAGPMIVTASKYATVSFIFDGTTWVELSRTVTV